MTVHPIHVRHQRRFADNRFVYPVISRRAGGLSLGVNLNPDKACNFDCMYCQVDRRTPGLTRFVELDRLAVELDRTLELVRSGELFADPRLRDAPPALRRLRDIAFSGDGEPTTHRNVDQAVELAAAVKRRRGLDDVRLVLITNASCLDRPHAQRALQVLDRNQGEVWAKLDAGSEAYFRRVARTAVPFQRILDNIIQAARVRPLVLQSLFMRIDGQPPPPEEWDAYCARVEQMLAQGARFRLIQLYTVARRPADPAVSPLADAEIDRAAEQVRRRTGLPVAAFYGLGVP